MTSGRKNVPSGRSALAWSFAERYVSLITTVGSTMILARVLTPAQVGVFSLCAAVMSVATMLRDFGVSEYLIQEKDLTPEKIRGAFAVAIITAWTIAAVVFFSRDAIAAYYAEPGVAAVLQVLTLNFLILPFASPAYALLNREMAFRKVFMVQTTSSAVQAATSVGLALSGFGYMSLAWGSLAAIATQVCLVTAVRPRESLILPNLRAARGVFAYGSVAVLSRVIDNITNNAHEFVIARQFGFEQVGLFSRALGLMNLFHHNVTSAILRVATPSLAVDHRAGVSLVGAFARGTAIFTSVAWPFFGFMALASLEIIRVLFGWQWDAAAPLATILASAMLLSSVIALGPNILAATGNVKRRLWISTMFGPVHVVGVLLASFISLEAIAAVWLFTSALLAGAYAIQLSAVLGTSAAKLFRPCLHSLLPTAAALMAQFAVLSACRAMVVAPVFALVAAVPATIVAWLIAVYVFKHPVRGELYRLAANLRGRMGSPRPHTPPT
jgi:O-antigen/teichoic acid export membrane protein